MQLVERHVITRADRRFAAIDRAAFASKNLYNAANYEVHKVAPDAFAQGSRGCVVHLVRLAV